MKKPELPREQYKTEEMLKAEAKQRAELEQAKLAARKKTPSQEKAENYWYHYKWHTIVGAVVLCFAVFFVKDLFFRTMPDASIVVVSGSYLSTEGLEELAGSLETAATDFNGDGKVIISTDSISIPAGDLSGASDESQPPQMQGNQMDYASSMKLMTVITAGTDPIYLLDKAAYDYITRPTEGGMSTADEIFAPLDGIPGAQGNALPFSATLLAQTGGGELDGLSFYLRASGRFEKDMDYYMYCHQLMEALAK